MSAPQTPTQVASNAVTDSVVNNESHVTAAGDGAATQETIDSRASTPIRHQSDDEDQTLTAALEPPTNMLPPPPPPMRGYDYEPRIIPSMAVLKGRLAILESVRKRFPLNQLLDDLLRADKIVDLADLVQASKDLGNDVMPYAEAKRVMVGITSQHATIRDILEPYEECSRAQAETSLLFNSLAMRNALYDLRPTRERRRRAQEAQRAREVTIVVPLIELGDSDTKRDSKRALDDLLALTEHGYEMKLFPVIEGTPPGCFTILGDRKGVEKVLQDALSADLMLKGLVSDQQVYCSWRHASSSSTSEWVSVRHRH
ncbi:hypothetical protein B0O80DRAFT_502197 [Mortierella sp. GBAus27b]|nr:hypothetical protein B0O80DRAFT_502197 [Mortierella sp. GBAus27b]